MAMAFSSGGELLATATYDGMLQVWDVGAGKRLHAWHAHEAVIEGVFFALEGKVLVSHAFDGRVGIWGVAP